MADPMTAPLSEPGDAVRAAAREAVELAAKATPGPWHSNQYLRLMDVAGPPSEKAAIVSWAGFDDCNRPMVRHRANGSLIAHAGTHYGAIAAALIEADTEVRRLRALLPPVAGEKEGTDAKG